MSDKLENYAVQPECFSSNPDPALIDLSGLSCIVISGADSSTFLQGQLTNNVNNLSNHQAQLTSYCTPKGRMLAIMYLIRLDENYLVILPEEIADSVISRLKMFVLRSKVEINLAADLTLAGACGLPGSELATLIGQDVPDQDFCLTQSDNNICIKIPATIDRYLYIGTPLKAADIKVYSGIYWTWLDIISGIPSLSSATQEAFVPQMANLELIDGVSFNKGCYPGQEIVARLHYLGNANRRMFRIECEGGQAIGAGDDIYTSGSGQSIGKVVSAVSDQSGHHHGLAVIRIDAVKSGELSVHSSQGNPVKILPLPYPVPTEPKEKTD